MTAGTKQPKPVRHERRIIERPRLIKMLDECEARVILLLAPAGYGKTTLARQWAKTLNGAIWVTLTPAHRDVARSPRTSLLESTISEGNASRFIGEYLRARSNPQRAAREVGLALAELLDERPRAMARPRRLPRGQRVSRARGTDFSDRGSREAPGSSSPPAHARSGRPHRRVLYREVEQIDRDDLAMDEDESKLMLGRRPDLDALVSQAEGWPAVLALGGRAPAAYAFRAARCRPSSTRSSPRSSISRSPKPASATPAASPRSGDVPRRDAGTAGRRRRTRHPTGARGWVPLGGSGHRPPSAGSGLPASEAF